MKNKEILDVTLLPPVRKHPAIFEKFDALTGGEGFIIHNDHDPKPLYYQMLAERGNIFQWEYLLSGPETWEVLITKNRIEQEAEALAPGSERKVAAFKDYDPGCGCAKE